RCFLSNFFFSTLIEPLSRPAARLDQPVSAFDVTPMLATSPADRAPAAEDLTFHPDSIAKPALDLQLRRDASDLLTSARCPVCRAPLVARMTCRGPQFLCLCDEAKSRAAAAVKPPALCADDQAPESIASVASSEDRSPVPTAI